MSKRISFCEKAASRIKAWLGLVATSAMALLLVTAAPGAAAQAAGPRTGLTVSMPNGFATVSATDLQLKSTAGDVLWTRLWNGKEWKFNARWESLSQGWKNLAGSQSADTTGSTGSSGNASAGGSGCWISVDDDQQYVLPSSGVVDPAVFASRTTPFNRSIAGAGADYAAPVTASIDYASLCPGVVSGTGTNQVEGLRRVNSLYLGENGHYAYSNRDSIEKRVVRALPAAEAAVVYNQLGTGQIALAPVNIAKGYRWLDRAGAWADYNTLGQMVAYGDRNANSVWLQRDTGGVLRGAVDATGRVLFTLHYTGPLITAVRDYPVAGNGQDLPPRSVGYQYDASARLVAVIDVRGNTTRFDYDAANRIAKVTDQEGRVEQLTYNDTTVAQRIAPDGGVTDYVFSYDDVNKQFLSRITGPATAAGRQVQDWAHNRAGRLVLYRNNGRNDDSVRYDTAARTETHTNARGFTSRQTRNEFDQVVQVQQTDGSFTGSNYSALHLQITEQTDENGVKTVYERDAAGNLLRMRQAAGLPEERVTEYALNALGQTTQVTRKGRVEADGSTTADAITRVDYDAQGQVRTVIDAEGQSRTYSFDRAGSVVATTDARGNTTRHETDPQGNLVRVNDPLGRSYSFTYDKTGNLTSLTDARGKSVLANYDSMNRLVQTTNAVGGIYTRQLDKLGQVTQETDEDGKSRQAQFDVFQRLTQTSDGLGNLTKYSYVIPDGSGAGTLGSLNGPTQIQYPTFTQNQRYDQRERPAAATLLNPSAQGLQTLPSSQAYDRIGQLTQTTDAYGKQRQRTYDALRQPIAFIDALGAKTQLKYDARGNLLSLTDALNHTYRFSYDRNDRVTAEILPLGQSTTYAYDASGNLLQRIDPNRNKAVYTYDTANRLKTIQRFNAQNIQVRDTSFTWDEADNLTAWNDTDLMRPAGQQTSSAVATFDDANRKTRETTTYPNPAGGTYQMGTGYGYSKAGRKTQLMWPDGTQIGYDYSAHGVVQSVTIPSEGSLSVNSYNWLAPAKITVPGGTTQEQTYDGLLKQQSLRVKGPSQQPILSLDNRYGSLQELDSKVRTDANPNGSSTTTSISYTYDDEVRLRQTTTQTGTGMSDVETFALDLAANRTAHSKTRGAWIYDANNRLLQSGTGPNSTSYEWSNAGNQIRKTEASGRVWQYRYDSQNRLSEVTDGSNNPIARYGYDPMDRRLWKEVYRNPQGDPINPGKRTYFVYVTEGPVGEAEQNVVLQADGNSIAIQPPVIGNQYGLRLNGPFFTGAWFVSNLKGADQRTVSYFGLERAKIQLLTTSGIGEVTSSVKIDSFGQATSNVGIYANEISSLRLSGQYYDPETGLNYNYHRYYDPTIGRYLTEDPIFSAAEWANKYAYVKGNPVNLNDPLGLYGTTDCTYYTKACASDGGWYECGLGGWICPQFPTGGKDSWFRCVRKCLQDARDWQKPDESLCGPQNNVPPLLNVLDHAACFSLCGLNPAKPFGEGTPETSE